MFIPSNVIHNPKIETHLGDYNYHTEENDVMVLDADERQFFYCKAAPPLSTLLLNLKHVNKISWYKYDESQNIKEVMNGVMNTLAREHQRKVPENCHRLVGRKSTPVEDLLGEDSFCDGWEACVNFLVKIGKLELK
jgi:hypothetical protein